MVQKHLAKQKATAEADALAALTRSVPGLSETMLRAALEACDWDVAAAQAHLQEYLASSGGGGKRDASSGSSSESDSGSRSGRKRRRKDEKKSKRDKHHKKSKRAKKERKEERKEERKRPAAIGDTQFGKYGVIKETDLWEKQPEFNLWLSEVKQRNPETLQKWEERDMFKVRDTSAAPACHCALMPHDLLPGVHGGLQHSHAASQEVLQPEPLARERGGARRTAWWGGRGAAHTVGLTFCSAAPELRCLLLLQAPISFENLEDERRRELAAERDRSKGSAGTALIEHMRLVGKLDGLREQQTLQKQLQLAAQIGDHEKVKQIQAKLAPDDPRKSAAAQNYGAWDAEAPCHRVISRAPPSRFPPVTVA